VVAVRVALQASRCRARLAPGHWRAQDNPTRDHQGDKQRRAHANPQAIFRVTPRCAFEFCSFLAQTTIPFTWLRAQRAFFAQSNMNLRALHH